MRIGVVTSAQPASVGGGFTFEQEVFERLLALSSESRHHYVVLQPGLAPKGPTPENVEFPLNLPKPLHGVANASRRLWLERTSKALEIDLLWCIAPFHPVTDTPYITISWDLQHRLQPFFPEVSANGEWDAREKHRSVCLRRAMRIICGTEVGKAEIERFYQIPSERIRVLPHPTPKFALDGVADDGILAKLPKDYLLYPAQLWAHKNHANLLLALKVLKDRGLELPLVLVGADRGNGDHVRRMIDELGLASQVHLIGFVPVGELVALYKNAAALAYVSLFGPDNLPPLEAMALGCPVIAANVSGAEEQLGDAALRIDGTSPDAIADAIQRVRTDTALRAQLIEKGRTRARKFTGDEYIRGIFGLVDDLVPLLRCWRPNR
ncbi:MAG TPA: glycosyltransferase family 1 protein [Kofleriaceae bacterium]|jgi:glycosyltransferase involved in cell wall biosynthesis|nr:glycosyltransferase family 1 protein [Kofleriaceae bacterium]